ncbi:MAG: rubber dioxygenase RoxB [Moraxellaceae bacterium]
MLHQLRIHLTLVPLTILLSACGPDSGNDTSSAGQPDSIGLSALSVSYTAPDYGGSTGGSSAGSGSGSSIGSVSNALPVNNYPLLGSSRGGSPLFDWCKNMPDDAVMPADPRTLVQPGVNAGKSVMFNAHWKDCHTNPEAVGEHAQHKTCGELRAGVTRGAALMTPGAVGSGVLFSGTTPFALESGFGIATFPSNSYNNLWRVWGGFLMRPNNFDQLVAERYGATFGNTPNPYPLPGEDPNRTNGGSGKLPTFFSQLRNEDGSWTGKIGITCHGCHSGGVGTPADGPGLGFLNGSGSSLADYNLFLRDMLPLGYPASAAMIANLNRTRGLNNASDINLAFFFQEQYKPDGSLLGLITSGSTADMNTPAWWNLGHRPVKFADGIFPTDAARVDMVFYTPIAGLFGAFGGPITDTAQSWMRKHSQDMNDWAAVLKAPAYPYPVTTTLAEQGAVIFHSKDLWAPSLKNPIARPNGGNGSCASCHGAYSQRFTNDPNYLDSPALEGIASYITPKRIIATDPARVDTNNEAVQVAGSRNFFGYPETAGTTQDCGMQNRADLRGDREPGYLAPPLYGIWATAPYLHNGSVPNLWEILKPTDRKAIWRRVSAPARWDQTGRVIMGYDTDLSRAFDKQKVGWKYDTIACQKKSLFNPGVTPYIDCVPGKEDADPLLQQLLSSLYGNVFATWNILFPPILTDKQIEERKIFNSHLYSQGNQGHEFNSVLTDQERLALIEYMKTL